MSVTVQIQSSRIRYCGSHQDSREHVYGGEDVGARELLLLCNVSNGPSSSEVLHKCGKSGQLVDILGRWAAQDRLQLCRGQLCTQLCEGTTVLLIQVVLHCSTLTIMRWHQEHIGVELRGGGSACIAVGTHRC